MSNTVNLTFVVLLCVVKVLSLGEIKIIAKRLEAKYNESYANVTTQLDLLPDDSYSFHFDADLFVELPSLFLTVGVAVPSANGKYDTIIVNSTANVCKYFKNNNGNMYLRIFFNGHFGDKKHLPSSCPIKPDKYFFGDFQLNDAILSIRVLDSKFLVFLSLCTKPKNTMICIVSLKFYGETRDRKKWQAKQERNKTKEAISI